MATCPVIAVIGSTGYVGLNCLMPVFLDALKSEKVKEVRVLTSEDKIQNCGRIKYFVNNGAKAHAVDYKNTSTVTTALQGVEVLVSALGTEGVDEVRETIIKASVEAGVKVYFPSEFGTNHYQISYQHPLFEGKHDHFVKAKEQGLNPIRMLVGHIMECSFGKWFGLDTEAGVWTVVGDGTVPSGMTAQRDVGLFTLEALLLALAYSGTSKCPDELEVYSDLRTLREYAKAFEAVSGKEIKFEQVPLETFKEEYEKTQEFEKLLMLLFAEGAYDYSKSTGNETLNPAESGWKLKKIEKFAEETGGVPGKESD